MKNVEGAGGVPEQEAGNGSAWWKTVTPGEMRGSATLVSNFLAAHGEASNAEAEAFARALALQQLFFDETAVWDAACEASRVMPECPSSSSSAAAALKAESWVSRGNAIEVGLTRCLELLRPQQEKSWLTSVQRFAVSLHLLQTDCESTAAHRGLAARITVSKPLKFKPPKI
ncbi:MAG TPA: hypothetical protein VEI25_19175 [Paraburkholderia sp.]|nr:hypothetical protein [Paraburkholderia sp.]